MKIDPKTALAECETLMLDMDGTVLDLAYDNYMWMHHVPEKFAAANGLEPDAAREQLYAKFCVVADCAAAVSHSEVGPRRG